GAAAASVSPGAVAKPPPAPALPLPKKSNGQPPHGKNAAAFAAEKEHPAGPHPLARYPRGSRTAGRLLQARRHGRTRRVPRAAAVAAFGTSALHPRRHH